MSLYFLKKAIISMHYLCIHIQTGNGCLYDLFNKLFYQHTFFIHPPPKKNKTKNKPPPPNQKHNLVYLNAYLTTRC